MSLKNYIHYHQFNVQMGHCNEESQKRYLGYFLKMKEEMDFLNARLSSICHIISQLGDDYCILFFEKYKKYTIQKIKKMNDEIQEDPYCGINGSESPNDYDINGSESPNDYDESDVIYW